MMVMENPVEKREQEIGLALMNLVVTRIFPSASSVRSVIMQNQEVYQGMMVMENPVRHHTSPLHHLKMKLKFLLDRFKKALTLTATTTSLLKLVAVISVE